MDDKDIGDAIKTNIVPILVFNCQTKCWSEMEYEYDAGITRYSLEFRLGISMCMISSCFIFD